MRGPCYQCGLAGAAIDASGGPWARGGVKTSAKPRFWPVLGRFPPLRIASNPARELKTRRFGVLYIPTSRFFWRLDDLRRLLLTGELDVSDRFGRYTSPNSGSLGAQPPAGCGAEPHEEILVKFAVSHANSG